MITRMLTVLEMDNITKKECATLRRVDAYYILVQGANNIMNVGHDVSEVQDEHKLRKQLLPMKSTRQQRVTTWLGQRQQLGGKDTRNTRLPFEDDEYIDDQDQT